nr:MAG TPA: hypothetical protein [Caudoviricetes sp.]
MVKQFISNITQNYVKTNIRLIGFVFILLIAIFALYGGYKLFHRETIEEHIKTPPMGKITNFMGTQNTKTTVGYVKKEFINGIKEDTDVEANIEQPKVTVKVNGKKQQFDLKQTETKKFEDGKVVVDQKSEVTFDVKVPDRHELNVYAQEEFRAGKFHHQVGVEKENGKFVYGAKYDFVDKEPFYYARYNLVKMYTN